MLIQAVRSVDSGSKFYRLPPDKENTDTAGLSEIDLSRYPVPQNKLMWTNC